MNYRNEGKAKEIERLLSFMEKGKNKGKTLDECFSDYAAAAKKAKGSVRNAYYDCLREGERSAEFFSRFLSGRALKAEKRETFSDEEEKDLLLGVFRLKKKGVSIRKALLSLSKGDEKKALRLQNKYRNLLVKNRPLVEEAMQEVKKECGECFDPYKEKDRDFLRYRLEKEIDGLYDRLSAVLRQKNEELSAEVLRLSLRNARLTALVKSAEAANGGDFVKVEEEELSKVAALREGEGRWQEEGGEGTAKPSSAVTKAARELCGEVEKNKPSVAPFS